MPRTPKSAHQKAVKDDQRNLPKHLKTFNCASTRPVNNYLWEAYEKYGKLSLNVPSPRVLLDGDFRFVLSLSKILYMYHETEDILCIRTRELFLKLEIK